MNLVLSIDLGTSGCRSAVFDDTLNMLCIATAEYPLIIQSDTEIEQDANLWYASVVDTIKRALTACPACIQEIRAISVSSQGIAVVPVDHAGNPLCHAISWLDARAAAETASLLNKQSLSAYYRITGKRLSSTYTLPKVLWLQAHRPQWMEKTWKLMLPMDYINFRLSGRCVTDHTMAAGTMLYEIGRQDWSLEILSQNHIAADLLPMLQWAGTPIGTISPRVAEELGLSKNVVIVNGAQDQKCAAYGAGIYGDAATVSLGTGCCITKRIDMPVADDSMRIPCFSFLLPNSWVLEGVIGTAGSAYNWFHDQFAPNTTFRTLDTLAMQAPVATKEIFYPFLAGASSPNWDLSNAGFLNLSFHSGLGEMARAVLEGIAYCIRSNLDVMDALCSYTKALLLFGGGSKSDLWCQIIADVTNRSVTRFTSTETALAGAAKLAFQGIGQKAAVSLPKAEVFYPDEKCVSIYRVGYESYETTRKRCATRIN
ncbi:MAG: FGGY family carbohydrate kinase [Clostridia bacterium]